jgi:pyruvate/2-oxoglutarate/acetoin dehydrogenase E1 component|tara:strand:- start:7252 stop:7791 length:540 start_codon:yes stop_codon:yes gene_type:complete
MNQDSRYKDALTNAMTFLGKQPDTIFIGQQTLYPGNPMSTTLGNVPKDKIIELPVMEDSQMGMSLGMAMTGDFVITFYPRWDFLICATNQLLNHLDKIKLMSNNQFNPNIIVRLGKGSDYPIDPGHQHKGDYFSEYQSLCKNITFHNLLSHEVIEDKYKEAYDKGGIHVIVEYPQLYTK